MKKQVFLMGIFSLVLIFGLIIIGCPTGGDEEDMTTKFEGTWRNPGGNHPAYVFIGDNFELSNSTEQSVLSGTFTFTDTTITFIPFSGESWTQDYTLEGEQLSLTNDSVHNYGDFIKTWSSQPTKFEGTWRNPGTRASTYVFTAGAFSFSDNTEYSFFGNFTFMETTITFIPSSGSQWVQNYTLIDSQLTIENDTSHPYGPFNKQ
jgi:hypothetical protein